MLIEPNRVQPSEPFKADAYCTTGSSPGTVVPTPRAVRGTASLPSGWAPVHYDTAPCTFQVPFEVVGPEQGPTVVVLGGISANRHVCASGEFSAPGWWRNLVGEGLAIDPSNWRVIGIDFLGLPGTYDSHDGPLSLTPEDQAAAVIAVLDHLGIAQVEAAVGSSYGGTVVLALGAEYADRVERLVVLASAHRPHPHATGVRVVQRRIVELDDESGTNTLALARTLALTTYTTASRMDKRFRHRGRLSGTAVGGVRSPVEDFLDDRSRRWANKFDRTSFLTLSASIDLSDVNPQKVTLPTTLIGWDEDALVPGWLIDELADSLAGPCRRVRLQSTWGHDAFLEGSTEQVAAIREALEAAS